MNFVDVNWLSQGDKFIFAPDVRLFTELQNCCPRGILVRHIFGRTPSLDNKAKVIVIATEEGEGDFSDQYQFFECPILCMSRKTLPQFIALLDAQIKGVARREFPDILWPEQAPSVAKVEEPGSDHHVTSWHHHFGG